MFTRRVLVKFTVAFVLLLGAGFALGSVVAASAGEGLSNANFIRAASADSRAQLAMAHAALRNSGNAGVRSLAAQIIADHEYADEALTHIADQHGMTFATPDAQTRTMMLRLNALHGAAFDTAYANAVIDTQLRTVKLYRSIETVPSGTDVRTYASNNLPVIKQHLYLAEALGDNHG